MGNFIFLFLTIFPHRRSSDRLGIVPTIRYAEYVLPVVSGAYIFDYFIKRKYP